MQNLLNISVLFSLLVACLSALLGHIFSAKAENTTTGSTPSKERETKTEVIKCTQPTDKKQQPQNSKAKKQAYLDLKQSNIRICG